jgi:hypothetical protein
MMIFDCFMKIYQYTFSPQPGKSGFFAITAIGIVFSILVFIGALACGVYVIKHNKSNRRRRVRQRPLQQPPIDGHLPNMPKLPNYFDTDNISILPPYLGFTDLAKAGGNSEIPPPYDVEEPPPYSITEAAETTGLETTVEQVTSNSNA